jgi:hypothetical protein
MRATAPIAITILIGAAIATFAGVLGNAIPSHWQTYVPMPVSNDFIAR